MRSGGSEAKECLQLQDVRGNTPAAYALRSGHESLAKKLGTGTNNCISHTIVTDCDADSTCEWDSTTCQKKTTTGDAAGGAGTGTNNCISHTIVTDCDAEGTWYFF